jgi:hypothetical protein
MRLLANNFPKNQDDGVKSEERADIATVCRQTLSDMKYQFSSVE